MNEKVHDTEIFFLQKRDFLYERYIYIYNYSSLIEYIVSKSRDTHV